MSRSVFRSLKYVECVGLSYVNSVLLTVHCANLFLSSVLLYVFLWNFILKSLFPFFLNLIFCFLERFFPRRRATYLRRKRFFDCNYTSHPRGMAISNLVGISPPAYILYTQRCFYLFRKTASGPRSSNWATSSVHFPELCLESPTWSVYRAILGFLPRLVSSASRKYSKWFRKKIIGASAQTPEVETKRARFYGKVPEQSPNLLAKCKLKLYPLPIDGQDYPITGLLSWLSVVILSCL